MFSQSLEVLDSIKLNFSSTAIMIMNITVAFIMFGVALDISLQRFKKLYHKPKSLIIGLFSQIVLLPAVTLLLILLIKPTPSVALGMILVASCPGGNISNFISSLSRANVELSVSMTAFSTISAIVITPFNFAFWGGIYATASPLLRPIQIDVWQVFQTVVILLAIPLLLGILFKTRFPKITKKIFKPVRLASIFAFLGFIIGAFSANFNNFINYIELIFFLVLLHNGFAFLSGYILSTIFKLPIHDRRSVAIETGIQNSGLALALIFNPAIFPVELETGGMAVIAGWWGIWHIISGLSIALFWNLKR